MEPRNINVKCMGPLDAEKKNIAVFIVSLIVSEFPQTRLKCNSAIACGTMEILCPIQQKDTNKEPRFLQVSLKRFAFVYLGSSENLSFYFKRERQLLTWSDNFSLQVCLGDYDHILLVCPAPQIQRNIKSCQKCRQICIRFWVL